MENEHSPHPPARVFADAPIYPPQDQPARLGLLTIDPNMPVRVDVDSLSDQVLIALHRIDELQFRIVDLERRLGLILGYAFSGQVPREFQEQGPGEDDL